MGLLDWMVKHGVAADDPDPEPAHKNWPAALLDSPPEKKEN